MSLQPNSRFENVRAHPRFGMVMGLQAKRRIEVGQEITVDYNYNVEFAPQWYQKLARGKCNVVKDNKGLELAAWGWALIFRRLRKRGQHCIMLYSVARTW